MKTPHGLASTALLLCLASLSSAAANFPRIVEIDLLVPQPNATYGPLGAFPIVLSIQNPDLLSVLRPSLSLTLWVAPDMEDTVPLQHDIDLASLHAKLNANTSEPAYPYAFSTNLTIPDGQDKATYALSWSLIAQNCTADSPNRPEESDDDRARNFGRFPRFTIARSAPAPNVTDAVVHPACGGSQGIAFNVVDTVDVGSSSPDQDSYCAVLDEKHPFPPVDPCGADPSAEALRNLTAQMSTLECAYAIDDSCIIESGAAGVFVGTVAVLAGMGVLFSLAESCF